ncbi:MAG: glycosyltransferase family 39 protein [Candidatus Levyibacteriota bacterium]|nr:MAG: glycosyltransferase family 39 protein [Candidatus Levybacteria bacterium]
MKQKYLFFLFFIILFSAAFLRLYKLGEVPPGPNRDEASIGYTAYSLLQTGKDEYGRWHPLSFQSFGDWKLPLYVYATEIFVKFLGLSAFAIRLPSVIFGIGSVVLTFFLAKRLSQSLAVAFFAMFFMAFSPWSIHFSRVASEANTAVFLTITATIFFYKGLQKQTYFIMSAIFFALTYFTYAGNYIFTTLLVLGLTFLYREEIFKKTYGIVAAILFILLSISIGYITFSANTTKISGIGIFGNSAVVHAQIEIPRNEYANPQSFFARLFYNRVSFAAEHFFQNYLMSFSPEFLFVKGGANRAHNIANFGNMYLLDVLPLFLGIFYLLSIKKNKEITVVLWWFFISPIAASITKDAPHSARMLAILPILPLVCSFGVFYFLSKIRQRYKQVLYIAMAGFIFAYAYSIGMYIDRYFIHFPKNESENWGAGYQYLTTILSADEYVGKEVIMSKPEHSPYIFLLFYSRFDPKIYQQIAIRYPITEDGFVHVNGFNRYVFREIDWEKDMQRLNTILIEESSSVSDSIKKMSKTKEITLLNGKSMFTIVETK